jgi:Rrf2 family transcriptional regulator, iron-sulfur cluster assembly transcription factor
MGFTSKSRVALVAMIDIAVHQRRGAVTAKSIAFRQQISLSYLEQLIARLRRSGLVAASRGPGGGYTLTREEGQISTFEILSAVDEGRLVCEPNSQAACEDESEVFVQRVRHDLWSGLDTAIMQHLQSVSLESLVAQQCASLLELAREELPKTANRYNLQSGIKQRREPAVYAKAITSGFALAQAWGGQSLSNA